jgi:hypothetical protein
MLETTITVGKQFVVLFGLFEMRVTLRPRLSGSAKKVAGKHTDTTADPRGRARPVGLQPTDWIRGHPRLPTPRSDQFPRRGCPEQVRAAGAFGCLRIQDRCPEVAATSKPDSRALGRDKIAALWLSHRLVQIAPGEPAMAVRGTFREGLIRAPIGSRESSMVPIGV